MPTLFVITHESIFFVPMQIADFRDRGDLNVEEFSIGLHKGFSEVEGKDIGQFPGTLTSQQEKPRELVQSLN
jgi:hypothetical protein